MLSYLLRVEGDNKIEQDSKDLKMQMFLLSHVVQDRELYSKIYPEDFGMTFEEEQDLNFQVPQSEEEFMEMLAEFGEEPPGVTNEYIDLPLRS